MNTDVLTIVTSWFSKLDNWQKDLFINLWKGKNVEELKIRTKKLAFKEYEIETTHLVAEIKFPEDIREDFSTNSQIMLKSMSDIQGVSALEPTNPLEFTKGLNVVYGANGCGKTSYVKVLKNAENPKENIKIYSNIFKSENVPAKATLIFDEDGVENKVNWNLSSQRVCPIRIYDTDVARRFVTDSTETIYEPKLLHIFTLMSEIYDHIYKEISDEISQKRNALVVVPNELQITDLCKVYENLETVNDINAFESQFAFSDTDSQELAVIEKSFETKDPLKAQRSLTTQILILTQLNQQISTVFLELADNKVIEYLKAINEQIKTRQAFEEFLSGFKTVSIISEFGSEKWKNMWKAVQDFEISILDKSSIENKCLLCQQDLSDEAKKRINQFQEIYVSDLEKKQETALKIFTGKTEQLGRLISDDLNSIDVKNKLITNSFDESIIDYYECLLEHLLKRANWLYNYDDSKTEAVSLPSFEDFKTTSTKFLNDKNNEYNALKSFVENHDKQVQQRLYLRTKKWFSENLENIKLKRNICQLNSILVKFKTNSITKTKNSLSEKLITEVYVERFNTELALLNPSKSINVELVSDGKKGKTSHRVCIKGAVNSKKTDEILSEGEARVVSIAAFLADLNSMGKTQAFVFDDPITSLDHNYEENVAKQLVSLSLERQVVVFTHRLAFAELLNYSMNELRKDKSLSEEETSFNYIELLRRPLGEPISNGQYNSLNFENTLNKIKNVELLNLGNLQDSGQYELYDDKLQSICSTIRKTIEKGIETELLSGVVLRHQMNVSSLKIRYINAIEEKDIRFFERMMTKYSFHEHSQSSEKPVGLPSIDEIKNDIDEMLEWKKDFKKRKKTYEKL